MDVLLDDFFYSLLQSGLNGIYNNDLNSIITTIDYIDTQLSNTNFVIDDPYLSQNEQLVVNNIRLKEIYSQYRLLFDVYRIYLEQTGANTNYATWLNMRNNSSPFNNDTPANYVNRQQPIWYVAKDTDGDGVVDEISPETDAGNRTKSWVDSTTLSAGLYRMIRGAVEPSGGAFSGRLLPKSKNLRGKSKQRRFRESGGTVYTDDGKEIDPGGYYEEWELDYLNDPIGGGGPGSDPRESFGDNFWNPGGGNIRGGSTDDYNYGGGRPTEEAIRRQRLFEEYQRTGGRSLQGYGSQTALGREPIGRMGTPLRSGISTVRIPIAPLGGSPGAPLSNAISVAPMMAPMGASGVGASDGYGGTSFMSSPLSSTTATPELYYSAPGLSPRDNSVGTNSSVSLGGITIGDPSVGSGSPIVNVGNCNPDQIVYSFKLRRIRFVEQRRFFGFNIKSAPKLEIILLAACPGQVGTPLLTYTVDSSIHYAFSPTSRGEFNIIATPNSTLNSVGKIKYQYYFDFQNILNTMLNNVANIKITPSETVYQNIRRRIASGGRPFVDVNTGILSLGQAQARKDEFFKQNNGISTGFITTLPKTIQDVGTGIPLLWYADATIPPNGMNLVENFFFMGNKDTVLSYSDVSTSTSVDGIYDRTDRVDKITTSLISSREGGEVENGTESGGGATSGTGGVTPISADKIKGSYKNNTYNVSWEFDNPGTRDCSAPSYFTNISTNGQMWYPRIDNQVGSIRYEYPAAFTSGPNPLLNPFVNRSDESIASDIITVLRQNGSLTPKELQTKFGLTPLQTNLPLNASAITLPGNPCLTGIPKYYVWGVRRIKKIPIKIFCEIAGVSANGQFGLREIDYRVKNSNIWNWMVGYLLQNAREFPARQDQFGNLLTNEDGYFYVESEDYLILSSNTPGQNPEWTQYTDIKFVPSNIGCNPVETVESSWRVDLDNPCGCDEVEVLTHYLTFPEITYKNPMDDTPTVIPSSRVKNPRYPQPLPESKEAAYGLSEGQQLTTNRRQKPDCFEGDGIGRLHHPFLYGTDILPGMRKKSIKGLFNLSQSLECYHTSSNQSNSQKEYYYEVTDCDNCEKTAYFAVSYGNWKGSGSIASGYERDDSPSRAIYSQYRLITLDPHEKYFTFYDGGELNTPDDIYVINYYRNGLSDKLDIGNFEINIAELSGSGKANNVHTGSNVEVSSSNKVLSLIDNSAIFDDEDVCANDDPNYYYDIVSGSLENGIHSSGAGTLQTNTSLTTYGKVYPNLGVIVLDGKKLNVSASFNSVSGSGINGDNSYKLFTAISGAAVLNKPMRARNVKFKTTNHYFVRIPSGEANYSNNPTYVIDSGNDKGKIKNICFVDNPMTYITTIGLYNTKKELIAVAKLSKPIKKTKENDILVKIRLNW